MKEIKLVKKSYNELQDLVIQLNTDKFILQSKIDKAIEYNKEVLTWTTNEPITDEIAYKNLEILEDKGEDK